VTGFVTSAITVSDPLTCDMGKIREMISLLSYID